MLFGTSLRCRGCLSCCRDLAPPPPDLLGWADLLGWVGLLAEPALLYLVPACLGSALLVALARGGLGSLFAYDEEDELVEEEEPTAGGAAKGAGTPAKGAAAVDDAPVSAHTRSATKKTN